MGETYAPPGGNGSFDKEQYNLLCRCADKGDFSEWNSLVDEIVEKYKAVLASGETPDIPEINLRGAHLANRNLMGIQLQFVRLDGANLSEADLRGADLRGANLWGAHLNGADLSGLQRPSERFKITNLSGANLGRADLRETNLERADLRGANLGRADLRETNLERADLSGANLESANLGGADLRKAHLEGTNLSGADLREADLREARLNGADLRESNLSEANLEALLTGANLNGANLTGVELSGLRVDPKLHTQLPMSENDTHTPQGGNGPFNREQYERLLRCEKEGDFSKWNEWIQKERNKHNESEILTYGRKKTYGIIKLAGADLTNLNLKGIDLMFAHLEGANLSGANLNDADLRGANLSGANLNDADLRGANLNDADLRGAYLSEVDLSRAYLNGADLRGAYIYDVKLEGAYIYDAKLEGANIYDAKLEGANICSASTWQMLTTLAEMKSAYAAAVAKKLQVPEVTASQAVQLFDLGDVAKKLQVPEVTAVQLARSLADPGFVALGESVAETGVLTEEGKKYAAEGLPERQILASIHGPTLVEVLAKHPLARIGVGWALKKNWITIDKGIVAAVDNPPEGEDEAALKHPDARMAGCKELEKRGLVEITKTASWKIFITPTGEKVAITKREIPGVGTLSREQILSGEWKNLSLRRYSVSKRPKKIYGGRVHPNQQILDEIRELLFEMGFTELYGSIVQSAFWNFDSLYQPQDHPAREMQDTFHLAETVGLPEGWEKIRDIHRTGGNTGSTGWGGEWSPEVARKCVLRTHSTSLSIQYLSTHSTPPVKAFSISRVYRRETIDPTHLPEFEQLEGIVMDKGLTFGHLLGFLKEFFERLGFDSVRFRPGYFPYTEPSVEPEVWVDGLGWVELGGAGVFRKEVTAPWGIDCPVLAWGLGESRVSMLRMGLKDIRQLYHSDINWIRATPVRRV